MKRAALIALLALGLIAVLVVSFWPRARPEPVAPAPHLIWVFEAPKPGSVVASPCVTAEAIYLASVHMHGSRTSGAVYSLDPINGKPRWVFDRNGGMLPTASSPLFADGRLFVGEGMHGHFACRLQCLDAATGQNRWEFNTGDHIEGGPAEFSGMVIVPAGNDGLYAVNVETGEQRWNFRADLHIDSTPIIANGRVFIGSGKSRRFNSFQVACLDARSGNPLWRTPVKLPAWGSPAVFEKRVYVGLGNGRLTESARAPEMPAGGLVCLDANSGNLLWTFSTGDAVFGRPAIAAERVVFGSRDGNLYGLTENGIEIYRISMVGPVVAGIADADGLVYAVSVAGRIVCAELATGREIWRYELGRTGIEPRVFAAPVVAGNRLFVAAEMAAGEVGIVSLFCFELPAREERRH